MADGIENSSPAENANQPRAELEAFASWLRLCAISRCAEEERGILEKWASQRFFKKANDDNVRSAFESGVGRRDPVFQSFEIYCFSHPKDQSVKPAYKQVLQQIAHRQSPLHAKNYAGKFFNAIARAVRNELVAMEKSQKFEPLHRDASSQEESNRFVDEQPLPGETMDAKSTLIVEDLARRCWENLSDRDKLFLWADSAGIPISHPLLLKKAGIEKSTAYLSLTQSCEALQETLKRLLTDEFRGGGSFSPLVRATVLCLSEKITSWAESENLHVGAFE